MRLIGTVLAAGALLTAVGTASAQDTFRLPFPYVFSGPAIEFGERVWNNGVLPAVEHVNKKGGIRGKKLEFYKVDTRFPETAQWIAEFRRLCEDKNVPVVMGVGATKSFLAIYEDTKRCGVTVFNPSSGGHWPQPDFAGWMFRYQPMPDDVLPILYDKSKKAFNIKTVSLSYTLDDEATAYNMRAARKILEEKGIKVVGETTFKTRETNFAAQVAAQRALNPDAIIMIHQPYDAGTFLLQLRERGINQQIVTDVIIGGADYWKLSQGKAKGSVGYAVYAATDDRPLVQDWVKTWRERTGKTKEAPDAFETAYYDAVLILAHVLNNAKGMGREDIRDAFAAVRELETISGKITWTKPGDVVRSEPILVKLGDDGLLERWNP